MSFRSQITDVLQIGNSDLYIAIADRWLPNMPSSLLLTKMIASGMDRMFGKPAKEESSSQGQKPKKVDNSNTARANYVWLPIRFEGDLPIIDWKSEWRIEDYLK